MRLPFFLLLGAALLVACGKPSDSPKAPAPAATPPTLLIAPEDLLTVVQSSLAQGPVVTGSVEPGKRADLRAEVAAVVVQVLKDNGDTVRAGDLLMRLDDTAIRDSLRSAEEARRAAAQAFEQAQRTVQRLKTLQGQGMTSIQALEDAEVRRNAAQSELAAAESRVVGARQQLERTMVRAPFAGIVSDRKASTGDTAGVGKELVKVIDPASMRFEGLVSADRLADIRIGQAVSFRINGFGDRPFAGRVQRVDAAVNAATRQVGLVVGFDDPAAAPRVAGLFAEGRVETGSVQVLAVPESVLVRSGEQVQVWRVQGRQLALVAVRVGERDPRSGAVPVRSGLAAGDRLLRNPSSTLVDGQAIEFAGASAAPALAPTPVSGAASAAK
jgi:membrane fusion protein, multidrug efflux system